MSWTIANSYLYGRHFDKLLTVVAAPKSFTKKLIALVFIPIHSKNGKLVTKYNHFQNS